MIGMPGEDHFSTVELFGQHRPEEHMRPGLAAKGNDMVRPCDQVRMMPVSPANGKNSITAAIITVTPDQRGHSLR